MRNEQCNSCLRPPFLPRQVFDAANEFKQAYSKTSPKDREKREQQQANVHTVGIGVGSDDYLVVVL